MMPILTSWFGSLALLGIVLGGFVFMFSPTRGKTILANVGIAVTLFVIGSMLVQSSCR
jgi:hypothetical protein